MKDFLIEKGFVHYASGCACIGLPRYYKHPDNPNYRIIIKGSTGIIKRNGVEIFRTKEVIKFNDKINEIL